MRTTFSPSPDVAAYLRDTAARRKKSLNERINELLRRGMEAEQERVPREEPFRLTEARKLGLRAGFDPEKLNEVLYELEMNER